MTDEPRAPGVSAAVPMFPSPDVARALHQYRDIGFTARIHPTGRYGYLRLGAARIDIITEEAFGEDVARSACSIDAEDPDALATLMREAGHGEVTLPENKPWGRREGVYRDADGNLIRFGRRLPGTY